MEKPNVTSAQLTQDAVKFIDNEFKNSDLKNNPEMVVAITELYKVLINN